VPETLTATERGSSLATPRHPDPVRASLRAVGIFLASRAVVVIGLLVAANVEHRSPEGLLTSWDARWYLEIARSGYVHTIPPGTGNAAQSDLGFFPMLPILIRLVHAVSGLGYARSAILLCLLVGIGAAVAVWWLLFDRYGAAGADRGTALICFWPGAFVLSYVYTEGLVVLLVALTLLALGRRRWVVAGLCAAAATAADPVAIAVLVPCAIAAYGAIRARRDWRALLAPLLAPLGMVSFFAYLWAHTGSPLEWFHAQRRGWQGGYYFAAVPKAAYSLLAHGVGNLNPGVKTLSAILALVLLIAFLRARPPAAWVGYVVAVLSLGVVSPIIGVTPRLILRDFPLLGVVGARLSQRRLLYVLAVCAVAMVSLIVAAATTRFTP
jgi:hypothetical protein